MLQVFCICGLVTLIPSLVMSKFLYSYQQEKLILEFKKKISPEDGADSEDDALFPCIIPRGVAIFLSLLCFIDAYGEGGMMTWANIYGRRVLRVDNAQSSIAYATFNAFMALGRLFCDKLRMRFGRRRLFVCSGFATSLGLGLVVLAPSLPAAIAFSSIGFSLMGLGFSIIFPISLSSAGHLPDVVPNRAVATVATAGNAGAIFGPVMIGVVSSGVQSLRLSFLLTIPLFCSISPLAFGVPAEIEKYKHIGSRGDPQKESLLGEEDPQHHHYKNNDATLA